MPTGQGLAGDGRDHALDRRRLLGGAVAMLGLSPAIGLAGQVGPAVENPAPPAPDPAALSANLLTRMAADVRLNRTGRSLFVLDTGAEQTAIARDLAERLALPAGPSLVVHGVTSAQITPSVLIQRLTFAGRHFETLIAPVFERSQLAADGLLGLDVLSRFRLSIDLERLRVTVAPSGPNALPLGSASLIPTRLQSVERGLGRFSQLILTNATADGVPVRALVDTGAQSSIANLALLRAIGGDRDGATLQVYGVTGQILQAIPGQVRDLRLAHQTLGSVPMLFADLHAFETLGLADSPALLIGGDLLYRFRRIDLDYGRGRMSFGGLRRFRTAATSGER